MRTIIIHIIYFSCFAIFGQSTKDNYIIFSKTIEFGISSFDSDIEFANFVDSRMKPFETVVLMENLDFEFKEDHLMLKNMKGVKNKDFIESLPDLDSTFTNHPKINTDSLDIKSLEVHSLPNKLFNELIDNSTSSYTKRWRKINRKFKHSLAIGLSKIKYSGNYASLYYWVDCGKIGLCKSEHVIVFKKVDGEWEILKDIYLWISP
ncbi:hypothetical protein H8K90_11630 [Winogradskyella echinorum]|uniref:DUF4440 domain-containing protein n=1 Tax=Winogradskyella echinorum TaxID=538189 RepID=A0ABR6Y2Y9_9FLAO|nr:hypothetical protein [Winogradskyella echinorum]MBC3847034.1 hypothetical protein [Winogradskyella echinorum]MBC5751382.1 hypothetical protein [Winogradskyella echinorum]